MATIKTQVRCEDCPSNFDFSKQNKTINIQPKATQFFDLIIAPNKRDKYGTYSLKINFFNNANQSIYKEQLEIHIIDIEKQPFELVKASLEDINSDLIPKEKETLLTIVVENKANRNYKKVKLNFEEQKEMTILGLTYFEETTWKAGEKKKFKLKFTLDNPTEISRFSMEAFILFGRKLENIYPFSIKDFSP